MPIYVPHRLSAQFVVNETPTVSDFVRDDLRLGQPTEGGTRSLTRYDSARSIVNVMKSGNRRVMPSLILISDDEFDWPDRTINGLLAQPVRWVERFDHVMILHATNLPAKRDGALICYQGTEEQLGTISYHAPRAVLAVRQVHLGAWMLCCEGVMFIHRRAFRQSSDRDTTVITVFADGNISAAGPIG